VRRDRDQPRRARGDTVLNVGLVGSMWVLLRILGVTIDATIVIATIGAVFGPSALHQGLERVRRE
jgi:hypothetical protein